jgi:hypothetical protein
VTALAARTAGIVGLAFATSCYTTVNVATLAPLHTAYPVSTSSQYVEGDGHIVTDRDYEVVHSFSLHPVVEAQPHHQSLAALALEPDLDRIMRTTGGDAITGMTIQAVEYDAGSHYPSAGLKLAGWTFGLTGAGVIALGAAVGEEEGTKVLEVGVVLAGVGVLSYVLGSALTRPATWQLDVSGNVVKRKGMRNWAGLVPARAR